MVHALTPRVVEIDKLGFLPEMQPNLHINIGLVAWDGPFHRQNKKFMNAI
jgi:hypothetical protein